MAISTYGVALKIKKTSSFETLVNIKDFPDLGGAPNQIETTTLADAAQTFIDGIKQQSPMEFTANYSKEDFIKINELDDGSQHDFQLNFGENGNDGMFGWSGTVRCWVTGAGVDNVIEMKISTTPSTEVELATI